jgi:hypothetical protein
VDVATGGRVGGQAQKVSASEDFRRPMAAEDCRQDLAVKRMLRGSTVQRAPANKFASHSNLGRRPQIAAPCAQRHGLNQVRSDLTLANKRRTIEVDLIIWRAFTTPA